MKCMDCDRPATHMTGLAQLQPRCDEHAKQTEHPGRRIRTDICRLCGIVHKGGMQCDGEP